MGHLFGKSIHYPSLFLLLLMLTRWMTLLEGLPIPLLLLLLLLLLLSPACLALLPDGLVHVDHRRGRGGRGRRRSDPVLCAPEAARQVQLPSLHGGFGGRRESGQGRALLICATCLRFRGEDWIFASLVAHRSSLLLVESFCRLFPSVPPSLSLSLRNSWCTATVISFHHYSVHSLFFFFLESIAVEKWKGCTPPSTKCYFSR